jgi:hypothetical protein
VTARSRFPPASISAIGCSSQCAGRGRRRCGARWASSGRARRWPRPATSAGGEAARRAWARRFPPAGPRATPRRSGNLGMRTQATRHSDCTTHLHGPKRSSLLDAHDDRARSRSSLPPSPPPLVGSGGWEVGGGCRRFPGVVRSTSNRTAPPSCDAAPVRSAEQHEHRVRLAREPRQPHRAPICSASARRRARRARMRHCAAARRAPRRTSRVARPDDPHPFRVTRCTQSRASSVRWRVHVGHPTVCATVTRRSARRAWFFPLPGGPAISSTARAAAHPQQHRIQRATTGRKGRGRRWRRGGGA